MAKRRRKAIIFAGFAVLFAAMLAACDTERFRGPRPTNPAALNTSSTSASKRAIFCAGKGIWTSRLEEKDDPRIERAA